MESTSRVRWAESVVNAAYCELQVSSGGVDAEFLFVLHPHTQSSFYDV